MRGLKGFYLVVFSILLCSFPVLSQDDAVNIKKLTDGAEVILSGKVLSQDSKWNSGKSKIYTYVKVLVDEQLKGAAAGESIIVRYLGGEVDDVGELYTHMPSFKNNEEVLLFLTKEEKEYRVFQGEQGKILLANEKGRLDSEKTAKLKQQIRKVIDGQ